MKTFRICAMLASAGAAVLLSGCVVAPLGHTPVAVYPQQPVYVEPAPVVVGPGYPGYGPRHHHRGHHGHRGYRGHGYWR